MRTNDKSIFLALFFLSGACGLTYEIVWSRLLVFVFGGTTFAITTVLSCFMGGLALGSFLAGRRVARVARPERLYGFLEIVIGLSALLVPVLMEKSTAIYRLLVPALGDNFLLLTTARVGVSAVILLLPTTAMGATLPLLAAAFTRRGSSIGRGVAALYGANTFGAFVGCAGAGFFLLPRLGLAGSTLTAALLNFLAGSVALLLSRRPDAGPATVARPAAEPAPPTRRGPRSLLLLYALSGFAAMAYQVAWTRALILSMGSSTYSFSTIVSCYIFGLAAGSLAMARWADKVRQPLVVAGLLQAAIALSALFVVPLFGRLPGVVARATALEGSTFGSVLLLQAVWVFGLLIVPTLCMGALLPLVCRIYDPTPEAAGRSVGDVYAFNTAGTIAGAAVAGFVLIPLDFVGMERTIYFASGLNLVVGTSFLLAQTPRKVSRYVLAATAWLVAVAAAGVTEPWSRQAMISGPYLGRESRADWDIVYYREGIDATVAVEKSAQDGLVLSVNGKPDASTLSGDMPTQILSGMIPLLLRPQARDVCLIGLGSGVTAGSILAFDIDRLDVAEISQAVVEASRLFDDVSRAPLDDPRLALYRADGRNFLLLGDRRYDVVVSEPSNPWISGIANLFTREFFELSRSRLVPGGIHAQWIQGYTMEPDSFGAVLRTLVEVFPHVQVWETGINDYLLLASTEPLAIDVEALYFSFSRVAVQEELQAIYITHPLQIANHYVSDADTMAAWLAPARILTDDLPYLEFTAPRFLLAETQNRIARTLFGFDGAPGFTGDATGALERRFLEGVERTKKRGRRYRDALEARQQGDQDAFVEALNDTMEFAPNDLRTLFLVAQEVRTLVASGARVEALDARVRRIRVGSWPFARRDPRPTAEALAAAGRRALDEGGDPRLATAHLLRAWLREPSNGRVIHDLARAYAARGEEEKAQQLFASARATGFTDDEPAPANNGS